MSRYRNIGKFRAAAFLLLAVVAASVTLSVALAPTRATAVETPQSGSNFKRPPTWQVRYDAGVVAERGNVVMRPGWHVAAGPAAIFWDDGRFAAGNYSVTSTIFLFPAGQGEPPSMVDAPYGLLFGGADLDGSAPSYMTFLLRNDGNFRIARHGGETVDEIVPWTRHDAIVTWSEGDAGTAKNVLALDATDAAVSFWVNDEEVASLRRGAVAAAGVVGVRAGEGLSLHITDIAIGPNRR